MLARLSQGLAAEELTRAHYITTFWFLGFESGHRQRQYARQSMTRPDAIRYLAEHTHLGWALDSPFFGGWCMGWKFEPLTVPPRCHQPGCSGTPLDESDFCGEHQG